MSLTEKVEASESKGFGTIGGVYIPSVLTILGVIMYLRCGWVYANVGFVGTFVIVTISTAITFITALSISATATNMKVGGGGAYYMISRSLGVEAGAAIGVPLFLAQSIGIAFYLAGFSESILDLFPGLNPIFVSTVFLVLLGATAYKSADLAIKIQYFIFGAILLSLLSYFMGDPASHTFEAPSVLPEKSSFWEVFAVFFPAVTGILTGVSMSGDLKSPEKSIPIGTLAAVITGYIIYLYIPLSLGLTVPEEILLTDPMIMKRVSYFGNLILVGVWGATLSSALGSLLAAPRTLQALARDQVVPAFLGKGHGPDDSPRVATAITFIVAFVAILLGDLNVIAPILTMFFLTSYGILNFSAAIEEVLHNPSWRPTFKVKWYLSFIGGFSCFAMCFMINPGATFISTFFVIGLYYFMQRRRMAVRWGDMRRGILMFLARYSVYRLAEYKNDAKSWRPNILVLSGSPTSRWYLITMADAITHGKGFLSVATVLQKESSARYRTDNIAGTMQEYLRKRHIPALVEVSTSDSVLKGSESLVQSYGLGPIVPNTIFMGETSKKENFRGFVELIKTIYVSQRNTIIFRNARSLEFINEVNRVKQIDVWWGRERHNAGLMLVLGYMLQISPEWSGSILNLRSVVLSESEVEGAETHLRALIEKSRLNAVVEIVLVKDKGQIFDTIRESSKGSDLVFIGMRPPERGGDLDDYADYYGQIYKKTEGFPPTAITIAAEDIEFNKIFES